MTDPDLEGMRARIDVMLELIAKVDEERSSALCEKFLQLAKGHSSAEVLLLLWWVTANLDCVEGVPLCVQLAVIARLHMPSEPGVVLLRHATREEKGQVH